MKLVSKYFTKEDIEDLRILEQKHKGYIAEVCSGGDNDYNLADLTDEEIITELRNCGIKVNENVVVIRQKESVDFYGKGC